MAEVVRAEPEHARRDGGFGLFGKRRHVRRSWLYSVAVRDSNPTRFVYLLRTPQILLALVSAAAIVVVFAPPAVQPYRRTVS